MAGAALVQSGGDVVNATTGEVVAVAPFSMIDYLASVSTPAAIETQQKLAAAYDTACRALIGPNDVQKEGTREFKKKSAWRKLGRHFKISTSVVRVDRELLGSDFLATITVCATAPWGQSAEAVGACCTDEAVGRRVITIADAIATAETRATNRAVSNLIAMGEVSAEEMQGKGGDAPAPRASRQDAPRSTSSAAPSRNGPVTVMPFGKYKGKLLLDLPTDELRSTADWCRSKGKFEDLEQACNVIIESREGLPLGVDGAHVDDDSDSPLPF